MGVVTAMREIKFRGRSINYVAANDSYWAYGLLVNDDPPEIECDDGDIYRVNDDTVGQYTGLEDADGREIYEGDIVRFELPPMVLTDEKTAAGAVVYEYGQFLVKIHAMRFTIFSVINGCTVIGNIHDTPELLS